ncbi:MAG: S41 family peptidase [Myxococcales bacterium]|nr:S41 family peptidase [Myxococcales bacterium]
MRTKQREWVRGSRRSSWTRRWALPLCLPLGLAALACDGPGTESESDAEEPAARAGDAPPGGGALAKAELHEHLKQKQQHAHEEPMPDARASFDEVLALVGEHYVDGPLAEDAVWTGAVEGVLGRLPQLAGHPINTLLSPDELKELEVGTSGQLVGVGVMIELVADVIMIRDVIPGAPAVAAGLQPGDRILGVDGVRVRDHALHDVVGRIRGEAGTTVELFVQRDTEEWTAVVTRGTVKVESVEGRLLDADKGLAYLRINSFSKTTPEEVDAALERLDGEGMKRLIIDVRRCPGGLLDASVAVADRFLEPGARVVTIRGRDGQETRYDASEKDRWEALPLAVLVGPKTASGAEILAGALAHHGRGPLIGEPPLGKRTVESVHELKNGWAVKLTSSRFETPDGEQGVRPAITIPSPEEALKYKRLEELSVESDPPLRAAYDLLATR